MRLSTRAVAAAVGVVLVGLIAVFISLTIGVVMGARGLDAVDDELGAALVRGRLIAERLVPPVPGDH